MTAPRGLLVVNTSESWGGNEQWALQTAAGLAARGVRVRFVWSGEAVGERVRGAGLDHRRLRLRGDGDLAGVLRLRREIVRLRADAVLPTRWREYLLGGVAARLSGPSRPRVALRLGLRLVPRDDLKRRLIFHLADRVIVNAPEIRAALLERPWIDPTRVTVVLNGVDLDLWRPRWEPATVAAGKAFRRELDIAPDAPLVLNVGALTPQKDHAGLLHAAAALRKRIPGVKVLILGEGFLRPGLEDLRRTLGLEDTVLLPGFRVDVRAAMAAADLFVLASDNEGMARVLVEAAASGLPAVATDVSGTRACVEDGRTGRVVPPADPAALAEACASLLGDPGDLSAMGRRARQLAEQRFDQTRMLDQTAAVLFGDTTETV